MKFTLSTRALFGTLFVLAALIGTPIAVYQLQQQQEVRQRADTTIAWSTSQSASTTCPTTGSGAIITATFSNTEPDKTYYSMDVTVVDKQTGKSVNIGTVRGGQTKSGVIQTGRTTLNAGSVEFSLKWTDGHSGTDSRTASYKAVSNCSPTPTITIKPSIKPSVSPTVSPKPSNGPTPTICPTLPPVKNVRIDCPNCPE